MTIRSPVNIHHLTATNFFLMMRSFNIYSPNYFQIFRAVLLIIITMLYIISPWLTHFIMKFVHFDPFHPFCLSPTHHLDIREDLWHVSQHHFPGVWRGKSISALAPNLPVGTDYIICGTQCQGPLFWLGQRKDSEVLLIYLFFSIGPLFPIPKELGKGASTPQHHLYSLGVMVLLY